MSRRQCRVCWRFAAPSTSSPSPSTFQDFEESRTATGAPAPAITQSLPEILSREHRALLLHEALGKRATQLGTSTAPC